MIRTYQYRLYPNRGQEALLGRMLEQAREVYNLALTQCENEYELFKGAAQPGEKFKMQMPTRQYAYFAEWINQPGILLTASATAQVLRRADKTYKNFFRNLKAGLRTRNGGPLQIRKRKYGEYTTLDFQYGHGATWKPNPANPERRVVRLTNVGDVKVRLHRGLPDDARIKAIQVTRKASGWYTSLQFETASLLVPANDQPPVGVVLGFQDLVKLSDGDALNNPKWLRHELAGLRRLQRRLSRCQKGSNNRKDRRLLVARLHEKIASIRRDFWHNVVCDLCRAYGIVITHETNMAHLLQGPYTALPAHDAAFGIFKEIMAYRAEELGSRWLPYQKQGLFNICSACEEVNEKQNERLFRCSSCGLELERGLNAARALLKLALNELREAKQSPASAEDLADLTGP